MPARAGKPTRGADAVQLPQGCEEGDDPPLRKRQSARALQDLGGLPVQLGRQRRKPVGEAVFSGVVSGAVSDPGLLKARIEGPELLTGGSFGMEHSVIALVLCTTTGVILLQIAIRRGHMMAPMWAR